MKIRMDELITVVSEALDAVEKDLLGVSDGHSRRVAVLCARMGEQMRLNEREMRLLTACALLHDNALTEYIRSEFRGEGNIGQHCIDGQRNIECLPFDADTDGVILYHHEYADGSGPFAKKEGKCPLTAELICIADTIDLEHRLRGMTADGLDALRKAIGADARFTGRAKQAMLGVLDEGMLESLSADRVGGTLASVMPAWTMELDDEAVARFAQLMARIIDFKSEFTKRHTMEIAQKAVRMSDYYGFDSMKRAQIYLAASLHDIGKLKTPEHILEKPGKLTDEEFTIIKDHVRYTYEMLKDVTGLDEVCRWASEHHEKLSGSGYPFGRREDELDFISRMMACIDIYQAVSEERPYHSARSHTDTMPILYGMAQKGFIDAGIVEDIDRVMGG